VTDVLSPSPRQQFFDNNGRPLVNGKLFTYEAGTNIKLATYTDSGGLSQNTNPIILDFRGECGLWIPPNVRYKYVLAPATDTDPPTNPIWSVDDIVSSQLLTLYGGVDTGVANAYVLNFDAAFTSYADGILLYWIPSNTNTAASTLNVNGLGPAPIRNSDGSPLVSGELVANQIAIVAMQSGSWVLVNSGAQYYGGAYTGTITGFAETITGTVLYRRVGNWITHLVNANLQGANSNSTALGLLGMPAAIRPGSPRIVPSFAMTDNGVQVGGWATVGTNGVITFSLGINGTGAFTAANAKGLRAGWSIGYPA
jgi:hypothetical protein